MSDDQQEMVENDAENLFGLIHARYILTNRGLHAMVRLNRSRSLMSASVVCCEIVLLARALHMQFSTACLIHCILTREIGFCAGTAALISFSSCLRCCRQLEKYRQCHFGRCPRVLCRGQPVLPVGLSDTVNQEVNSKRLPNDRGASCVSRRFAPSHLFCDR